jgi:predicted ATPase/DNA-binding SARP family transcriptional activator
MIFEPWHIQLLGGLRLQQRDTTITRFKTQKIAGLLAYLAYHLRQAHPREVLIDLFWPESELEAGRGSLSVALSSLRNQLEPPGTPAHAVLRADRFSISLNPQAVTTDVADFEAAAKATGRAGSATERAQSLERAVDLYRGRLLPGMYEEWILPEETHLAGLFFDSVSALITHLEESGRSGEALRYARRAVSVDPLREEAHGHLMHLLAATGQPGAALRQYREMERLLDEEMGEEPSAPLRALARQIEKDSGVSAPAAHPARSSGSPRTENLSGLTVGPGRPTTLTFLLTDIEGSTHLWEQNGEAFRGVLETHHAALRGAFVLHGGQEITEAGDSFVVAFTSVRQALTCAAAGQQALAEAAWPAEIGPLRVRMAVRTGDVTLEDGDYHGLALHRGSRMLAAAHGGQILVSEATAALAQVDPGDDLRLADLGVWRLRDVAAPQRLFQLEYPGMGGVEFPAPSAAAGYQSSLPLQHTRFFGREAEIARLEEILSSVTPSPSHLVTLTGPGGTGKSRLAVAVAERLLETFQGAVWFVGLADLADPDLIAGTILDALRLPRSPQRAPLEQVVETVSKQPSLLILDNFEHLLREPAPGPKRRKSASAQAQSRPIIENPESDGGAQIVQRLLSRVPTLAILVTSRQLLSLLGEREFPVPPLPTPNGGEPPEQLSLFDSVRLFVDRAQAVLPYFQVSNANAPSVAELCDRLEGLPLAIELAAARAQVMTPAQMLAQLANRFAFLTSRKRGVEERHRTLRAAVEWSYRLLTPELQRYFCRLSVFRGGWTVEAAEAVCEEPLALDYLALLRECSLILSEETAQGMRFRMLETLREYAQECLAEAAESVVCGRRHADYFLDLAEQAEPKLQGPEQAEWLERLETEHDNLRAAMEWCKTQQADAEAGLRLAGALGRFWFVHGHLTEGRSHLEAVLSRKEAQARTKARARALNGAGNLASCQSDYVSARALHEESLTIQRELGDRRGIGSSLNNLGIVAREHGDYASARTLYEQSLALGRELEDRRGIAASLTNLGLVAYVQGDYAAARAYHEQSLEIQRQIGDRQGIAGSLHNLGSVAWSQGDYVAAQKLYEEALFTNRVLGNRAWESYNLGNLGNVADNQGDYAAARAYHEQSLEIQRQIGDRKGIANSLNGLGKVAYEQGDYTAARAYSEQSLVIFREIGYRHGIANSLNAFAHLASAEAVAATDSTGTATTSSHMADGLRCAARLWGAAEALREELRAVLPPNEREEYERLVSQAREALGEEAFAAAWEAGRAMTWEEAIAYALQESGV